MSDDETLIRLIVSPVHINTSKRVPKAGALAQAESGGLSIFRSGHATDEEILKAAEKLVQRARANDERAGIFGVFLMPCSVARSLRGTGDDAPAYCVYDTAEPDKPARGEAFQRAAFADKSLQDSRRNNPFAEVRLTFVPVEDFRQGLLLGLAPAR